MSGKVALATPDRRLRRNVIFIGITGILREWDVYIQKSVQNSKIESLPQTDRWYRNGWIERVVLHR